MTQENVEIVRSIHAAWERGDYSSADWAHPEIEYVHADGLDQGSWRGLAGMAKGFRDVLRPWEEMRVKADEYRELDAGRVLFNFTGRGKGSGLKAWPDPDGGGAAFPHQRRQGDPTRPVPRA